jgi:hypothetical protein
MTQMSPAAAELMNFEIVAHGVAIDLAWVVVLLSLPTAKPLEAAFET